MKIHLNVYTRISQNSFINAFFLLWSHFHAHITCISLSDLYSVAAFPGESWFSKLGSNSCSIFFWNTLLKDAYHSKTRSLANGLCLLCCFLIYANYFFENTGLPFKLVLFVLDVVCLVVCEKQGDAWSQVAVDAAHVARSADDGVHMLVTIPNTLLHLQIQYLSFT